MKSIYRNANNSFHLKIKTRFIFYANIISISLLSFSCSSLSDDQIKTEAISPKVVQLVKSTKSWDGSPLPDYPVQKPEITILYITVPAGAKLKTHKPPVINAGYMLNGSIKVITMDGKILTLNKGDSIVEVVNKEHYGINESNEPAEILVFYMLDPKGFQ